MNIVSVFDSNVRKYADKPMRTVRVAGPGVDLRVVGIDGRDTQGGEVGEMWLKPNRRCTATSTTNAPRRKPSAMAGREMLPRTATGKLMKHGLRASV